MHNTAVADSDHHTAAPFARAAAFPEAQQLARAIALMMPRQLEAHLDRIREDADGSIQWRGSPTMRVHRVTVHGAAAESLISRCDAAWHWCMQILPANDRLQLVATTARLADAPADAQRHVLDQCVYAARGSITHMPGDMLSVTIGDVSVIGTEATVSALFTGAAVRALQTPTSVA